MHPKIRLKPTPYEANTSACTASDVVYGESPNQTGGRTTRIAAATTIGQERPADAARHDRHRDAAALSVSAIAPTVRAARAAG